MPLSPKRWATSFLEAFKAEVCCAAGMRKQNITSIIICRSPEAISFSRSTLRVAGDPVLSVCGQVGVGIARSVWAERTCVLSDSSQVSNCMCAVILDAVVCMNKSRLKRYCLIAVSVHAPDDWSSPELEDKFYRLLSWLLWNLGSPGVEVVAGAFNAQLG